MPYTETDLNRMAQAFYEATTDSPEIIYPRMTGKAAVVEGLRAALKRVEPAEVDHKEQAEILLVRSIAQGRVEGMNIDSVRAQAAATLALVEVTERLAVAQETANLIARQVWATNTAIAVGSISDEVLEMGTEASEDIARRLAGYTS